MGWADILLRRHIRILVAAFEEIVSQLATGCFGVGGGGVALFRLGDPDIAPGIFCQQTSLFPYLT